jgi:hypothetical protein
MMLDSARAMRMLAYGQSVAIMHLGHFWKPSSGTHLSVGIWSNPDWLDDRNHALLTTPADRVRQDIGD